MRKTVRKLREVAAIVVGGMAAFAVFATVVLLGGLEWIVRWSLRILFLPFILLASLLYPERMPLRERIARDVREWIRLTDSAN
jgi:magnesium-transporting ATPase (P-type)